MSVNNNFNAAFTEVTIYSSEGTAHKCTRLNAIDLIRTAGYSWQAPAADAAPEEAAEEAPVAEEPVDEAPTEELVEEAPEEFKAEDKAVDHINDPLAEIAEAITGSSDVVKYLEGFTADALRTMSEERYNEKLHARIGKDKAIEKIVAFEESKTASEMDD